MLSGSGDLTDIEKRQKIDDALTSLDLEKIKALHQANENLYVSDLITFSAAYAKSEDKADLSALVSYLALHFPTIVVDVNNDVPSIRTVYENLIRKGINRQALAHLKGREQLTNFYKKVHAIKDLYNDLIKCPFTTDNIEELVYLDLERVIAATHPLLSLNNYLDVITMERLLYDTIPTQIRTPFMDLAKGANRYADRATDIHVILKRYKKHVLSMSTLQQIYYTETKADGGSARWRFTTKHSYQLSIERPATEASYIHAYFEIMLDKDTYTISDPDYDADKIYMNISRDTAFEQQHRMTDHHTDYHSYRKFMKMIDTLNTILDKSSNNNELAYSQKTFRFIIDIESIHVLKPLLDYCTYVDEDDVDETQTYSINAKDLMTIFYEESAIHEIEGLLAEKEFENIAEPHKDLATSMQIFMHQINDEETPELKFLESKKSNSLLVAPLGSLHVELLTLHLANHGCAPSDSNAKCRKFSSATLIPAVRKIQEQAGDWPHLMTNIKWLHQFLKIHADMYGVSYANGDLNLTCLSQGIGSYCLLALLQLPFVKQITKSSYRLSLTGIADIPYEVMDAIIVEAHQKAKTETMDLLYKCRDAASVNEDGRGYFNMDGKFYLNVKQERRAALQPLLGNFDCVESSPDVLCIDIDDIWNNHLLNYDAIKKQVEQRLRCVNRIVSMISQFNKPKRTYMTDGIMLQFSDQEVEKRFNKVISFADKTELGYKLPYAVLFKLSNDGLTLLEYHTKHQSPHAFQKRQQDYQHALSKIFQITKTWQRANDEFRITYESYDVNCVKWLIETLDIDGIQTCEGPPLSLIIQPEKLPILDQIRFESCVNLIDTFRQKIRIVEGIVGKLAVHLQLTHRSLNFTFKSVEHLKHFNQACCQTFGVVSEDNLSVSIPYLACVKVDLQTLQMMSNSLVQLLMPAKRTEEDTSPRILRIKTISKDKDQTGKTAQQKLAKQTNNKKPKVSKNKNKAKSSKSTKSSAPAPARAATPVVIQKKVVIETLPPVEPVSAEVRELALHARELDFAVIESKPKVVLPRAPSPVEVVAIEGFEYEGSLAADLNLLITASEWFSSRKVDEIDAQAFHAAHWFTFVKIFNAIGTRAHEKPGCVQLSDHQDHKALKVRNTILHDLNDFAEVMPLHNKLLSDNFETSVRSIIDHEKPQAPASRMVYKNYYHGFFQLQPLIHPVTGIRSIMQRMCNFQTKYFDPANQCSEKDRAVGRRAILGCIVKLSDFHKRSIVEQVNVDEIAGLLPFLESIRESRNSSCHQFINNRDTGFGPLTDEVIDKIAVDGKSHWELFCLSEEKRLQLTP